MIAELPKMSENQAEWLASGPARRLENAEKLKRERDEVFRDFHNHLPPNVRDILRPSQ